MIKHLRGHVKRRAQRGLREVIRSLESFAESEVSELKVSRFEKDVIWFDIPMQNEMLMQRLDRCYQLPKQHQRVLLLKLPPIPHQFLQGPPFAVLIHQIHIIVSLHHLHKLHNVQIILQHLQSIYLVPCEFCQLANFCKLIQSHHFDRNLDPRIHVECTIHLTVFPLAQVICQRVVIYDLDH